MHRDFVTFLGNSFISGGETTDNRYCDDVRMDPAVLRQGLAGEAKTDMRDPDWPRQKAVEKTRSNGFAAGDADEGSDAAEPDAAEPLSVIAVPVAIANIPLYAFLLNSQPRPRKVTRAERALIRHTLNGLMRRKAARHAIGRKYNISARTISRIQANEYRDNLALDQKYIREHDLAREQRGGDVGMESAEDVSLGFRVLLLLADR